MPFETKPFRPPLPPWIRVGFANGGNSRGIHTLVSDLELHTVCQGARCPNQCECWNRGTAAFLILGEHCTRDCRFCAVGHTDHPLPPDPDEAEKVAAAAKKLHLKYVVVTGVTRDDLPDGGASAFAAATSALKRAVPGIRVEVLTSDFQGDRADIETAMRGVDVFNHNVETVERLSEPVRRIARYRRSLEVLRIAFQLGGGKIPVKSGIMAGMGETDDEVERTICDIAETGATLLTIGQYLPPSGKHWPLARYVEPSVFEAWKTFALNRGFRHVASGPLVRSSYEADLLQK